MLLTNDVMRDHSLVVTLALGAGLCAGTLAPVVVGAVPGEMAASETPTDPTDHSDSATGAALKQEPATPTQGTACIIDSQGRVTRLKFQSSPGGFDREGWLKRVKEFEERRAEARAENERLRLQWIAEERQRAREEAMRQAALEVEAGRNRGSDYGWVLGGYGYRLPHGGHGRPRPPVKGSSKPRPEPSKPIFLPAPNLTSPFPHSSTKNPKSANKSFLP